MISESGIKSVEDTRRVAAAGVHGALIGESLMRAANPQALLKSFRAGGARGIRPRGSARGIRLKRQDNFPCALA